ncbi:hypothetical protein KORDIASMS9_00989 [Kordia sp. SMS9]|uniref:hypothetical protein n=1 Tax=Kordia sp. SMS9 TaxID=2282170 RepID=UPI000E0D87D6|nr:hypothetical protein [Kordia sp. SMS9]AXG68773.1 hypothetical protein KORDIASMS9_00989 [Kordia sp. SMS9]
MAENSANKPVNDEQYNAKITKNLKKGGYGCLTFLVIMMIIGYCADKSIEAEESKDIRYQYLYADMKKVKNTVSEDDPLTLIAKKCVESGIYIETQEKKFLQKTKKAKKRLNKKAIKYFTKQNDGKLLVILQISQLETVESSTTDVFIEALLGCYSYVEDETGIDEYYIAIRSGDKTYDAHSPEGYDGYSIDKMLLPFYGEKVTEE